MQTFIRDVIDTGSRQRLPELFASAPAEVPYYVPERGGVSVVALRTTSLREEQLVKLLKYRWAQYLHPAVNIHDARRVRELSQEHEPLSEVQPDDVHVIAGAVETGHILCYSVLRSPPAVSPGTTLRTCERPLLQVERFHGWGIYNRLRVLPDLPLSRIRELGRFVKNQELHTFDALGARGPVEVVTAVLRLLLGPLRHEVEAVVGDLEEGVSKQNFDFFHLPTVLIRGTVPYEPEDGIAFPRYQCRTIYPAAVLVSDIETVVPRLEAIERALERPEKQGLRALFTLKHELLTPTSSLEPPEGLPALTATPVPQPELGMRTRRAMLDAGARLRSMELFRSLSVAEAAVLGSFMERREIPAGQFLLRQGEPGDDLYLIEAGEAEMRIPSPSGEARVLARLGPGDHLGEIASQAGSARTADVIALTPLTVLRLPRTAYAQYLADIPEVDQQMARTAAYRTGEQECRLLANQPSKTRRERKTMSIVEYDLKTMPPPDPETFAAHLDRKIAAVLAQIEQSEVYRLVSDPATDGRLLTAVVKYVLLEVFSCGPHITEATFAAISRLPKHRPDLMKPMVLHDLSEVDHGEMALRDYVKLGGDEDWARSRRITPASWAMSATCRMLGERESPFAYLGYMYLLESLTPTLTAWVQKILKARSFPTDAQTFIDVHALEDIAHSRTLRDLIIRVIGDYPEAASAIEYGFDCFAQVYPLPIWTAALQHARAEAGVRELVHAA